MLILLSKRASLAGPVAPGRVVPFYALVDVLLDAVGDERPLVFDPLHDCAVVRQGADALVVNAVAVVVDHAGDGVDIFPLPHSVYGSVRLDGDLAGAPVFHRGDDVYFDAVAVRVCLRRVYGLFPDGGRADVLSVAYEFEVGNFHVLLLLSSGPLPGSPK